MMLKELYVLLIKNTILVKIWLLLKTRKFF